VSFLTRNKCEKVNPAEEVFLRRVRLFLRLPSGRSEWHQHGTGREAGGYRMERNLRRRKWWDAYTRWQRATLTGVGAGLIHVPVVSVCLVGVV